MSNAEELVVNSILRDFINDSIPDYILEMAQGIVAENGVVKLDLKKRDQYWDIDGQVAGDDFQNYTSEIGLNLSEKTINYYCNCPDSFSGVCRHVAATALKLKKSLETESGEEMPAPRTDWRQTFRPFFATELEPEAGRHYLIYRIYPELGRLQVAFFRARQNKSGISQVQNEVTPGPNRGEPGLVRHLARPARRGRTDRPLPRLLGDTRWRSLQASIPGFSARSKTSTTCISGKATNP